MPARVDRSWQDEEHPWGAVLGVGGVHAKTTGSDCVGLRGRGQILVKPENGRAEARAGGEGTRVHYK